MTVVGQEFPNGRCCSAMDNDCIEVLLNKGVVEGVYPGAVLLVAFEGEIRLFQHVGSRALVPETVPMERETVFDLASLTKPLATTLAAMKLIDSAIIELDQPLEDLLPKVLPQDKKTITSRLLLSHSAGFADWKPFYLELDHIRREESNPLCFSKNPDNPDRAFECFEHYRF